MDTKLLIEIFGYIGSALVVFSMLMTSVVKLRIINTIGNIVSGTYGVIIGSFPLVAMNACLLLINIYNLFKLFRPEKNYDLLKSQPNDAYVGYFISHYLKDIKRYFPKFDANALPNLVYLVFCNGEAAGIFLGKQENESTIDIVVDYTTPTYRDCSVAAYLHSKLPKLGVEKLLFSQGEISSHVNHLKKMGYEKENGIYIKKLK